MEQNQEDYSDLSLGPISDFDDPDLNDQFDGEVEEAAANLQRVVDENEETSPDYHLGILCLRLNYALAPRLFTGMLKKIVEDEKRTLDVRCAAFGAWMVFLWRWNNHKQLREIFDDYYEKFQKNSPHLISLYQGMYDLSKDLSKEDRQQSVKSTKKAMDAMPNVPYALNLYTGAVAKSGEFDGAKDDLDQAMKAIDKAVLEAEEYDPEYAMYYANRARILALKKRYDEADWNITKAMQIETKEHGDYQARISLYESIRTLIQQKRSSSEIKHQRMEFEQKIQESEKQLVSMRGETLTYLGLLAAVIAFVVSSVQLVSEMTSVATGILLTIMAGLLLIVFGSFVELIQPGEGWRRKSLYVVLISAAIVILAGLGLLFLPMPD